MWGWALEYCWPKFNLSKTPMREGLDRTCPIRSRCGAYLLGQLDFGLCVRCTGTISAIICDTQGPRLILGGLIWVRLELSTGPQSSPVSLPFTLNKGHTEKSYAHPKLLKCKQTVCATSLPFPYQFRARGSVPESNSSHTPVRTLLHTLEIRIQLTR